MTRGFDKERGCFTQYYGSKEMDASLLPIAFVDMLPSDDPRVIGTVEAVEKDLLKNGFVLRYVTTGHVDGLEGEEGAFLACSFWLVRAYVRIGRRADAEKLFDRLVSLCNDVGLLAEEYDPVGKRHLGNFPQAFSHLALIQAAYDLAERPAEMTLH